MKTMLRFSAKIIGVVFMVLAVLQWITFDYPEVNPFKLGGIFAAGMISQILNWLIVSVLAAIGWGLFTLGKFKLSSSAERQNPK